MSSNKKDLNLPTSAGSPFKTEDFNKFFFGIIIAALIVVILLITYFILMTKHA